jgi:beta-galactosidase GanA
MDETGYYNYPLGAKALDAPTIAAIADKYALLAPIASDWATIAATHPTWGVAKGEDGAAQSTTMGDWTITAGFGEWQFGQKSWSWIKSEPPEWANRAVGGGVVAQLSADSILVMGDHVRFDFAGRAGGPANGMIVRVEEGTLKNGTWVTSRVWNGDQTDYGLNIIDRPVLLRVTMGHFR